MTAPARLPKLLVVDDQTVNIQILFSIFRADHEVFMATSGEQALVTCDAQKPDLILLDVVMAGIDGYEVCRRLKANPATHDIPVIFVTARDDPSEETLGLQLGAVDFIRKPVNAPVVRARVKTQLALRQLSVLLEDTVAKRTRDLEVALQRLHESREQLTVSEAKATLSTLIASVSHEMGTPLGNSVMLASTLNDQARKMASAVDAGQLKRADLTDFIAHQTEGSQMILGNLKRAADLLTSFRQVAADQASEQRREFDLAVVIHEILATLTPMFKRHLHRLQVNVPPGIVMDSQPGPLGQVLINLVNNAYLHAFEGRDNGTLSISAEVQGDHVVIRFEDDGIGMSPEHLARLFEPFFSTKIGKGGTGLGMAIVENLVRKTLGGDLKVQSTPGAGTRFDIVLPLKLG